MVIFEYKLPGHACHPRTTVLCKCHHLYIPLLLRHLYQSAKNNHVMIAFHTPFQPFTAFHVQRHKFLFFFAFLYTKEERRILSTN